MTVCMAAIHSSRSSDLSAEKMKARDGVFT
jgi:hypothetical protein